jgi:hypothetical protein
MVNQLRDIFRQKDRKPDTPAIALMSHLNRPSYKTFHRLCNKFNSLLKQFMPLLIESVIELKGKIMQARCQAPESIFTQFEKLALQFQILHKQVSRSTIISDEELYPFLFGLYTSKRINKPTQNGQIPSTRAP